MALSGAVGRRRSASVEGLALAGNLGLCEAGALGEGLRLARVPAPKETPVGS
jgi:hypothetical protein